MALFSLIIFFKGIGKKILSNHTYKHIIQNNKYLYNIIWTISLNDMFFIDIQPEWDEW